MMCLYPRLVDNPKYKRTKKNGGIIPPLTDQRIKAVPIGCGTCKECRDKKSREWQIRLQEDIKTHTNGIFVTLTYSTESLKKIIEEDIPNPKGNKWQQTGLKYLQGYDLDNAIAIKSTRLFLERWRKKHKKSLRHWLVTELGGEHSEHMHMHGIIWTDKPEEIEKYWQYGTVWRGYKDHNNKYENYVSAKTVNYIIKYINKVDEKHLNYKPIILTTPGIGDNYTKSYNAIKNKYHEGKTNETYRTSTGHKMAIPIYWRNKIYSEEEREKLWIEKLDKGDRYICGEKIKDNDEETYYNVLEYHRKRTGKLGYPDPQFIWSKKKYEEDRRRLIHENRLKKPSRNSTF